MARPETIKFGKFFVRLSDGATPAVFTAPCGFTSKSFTRNKTLNEVQVPDCDDPDAAAWTERDVQSMAATISGSGVLAKAAMPAWEEALESTESVAAQIEFVYADETSDFYEGRFHIESLEINGSLGERVQVSVTMQSDGEITYERTA